MSFLSIFLASNATGNSSESLCPSWLSASVTSRAREIVGFAGSGPIFES